MIERFVGAVSVADIVEDEELSFGSKEDRVCNPGGLDVGFGFASHIARIAFVGLEGDRVVDVTGEDECRDVSNRINEGGFGIGHQEHVRFVDLLKAADGGTVEWQSFREKLFIEAAHGDREVLPGAGHINEAHVHQFYVFAQLEYISYSFCHFLTPSYWFL